jgi:starch phosphorylase
LATTFVQPTVAYFCMEYGLDAELPIYAGGLGVLAGDTLKSAGDLGLPLIGIGLLWADGYTHQLIDDEGRPHDTYRPTPRDALRLIDATVTVDIAGAPVPCSAYQVTAYTRARLYLLEPAREADRWITRRLYGGGARGRVAQEMLLGIGGVRLLRALGVKVDVYHFNEGHAVFAGLELIRERRGPGVTFAAAAARVRRRIVFTTHTPVAAGNESHDLALLGELGAGCGATDAELASLGGSPFSMTAAGLRLARGANAVAEAHGATARAMWRHLDGAAPLCAITNGVHAPTWQDARIRAAMAAVSSAEQSARLWTSHQEMKAELLATIWERTGVRLAEDALVIGFARRAAAYKRADLIFGDAERIGGLLASGRVQLVFSGKAHPADLAGKEMIARLVASARAWSGRVVFLANYDMALGALLTRGCDVWLNNPLPPLEASGTSGMKAAQNGVLNASILDGWWPEGCRHGETGWHIASGEHDPAGTRAEQDRRDREALYRVLEDEILPCYEGSRARWTGMMAASIRMAQERFSSHRMVEDYFARLYRAQPGAPVRVRPGRWRGRSSAA